MNTRLAQQQLRKMATPGVSQYNINPSSLRSRFLVPLPTRRDQQEIVDILGAWDQAIAAYGRILDAKRLLQSGFIHDLLTGTMRFPEFQASTGRQQTQFGDLPEDWQYARVADIANEVSLRAGRGNAAPVLACSKYDGLVESLSYFGRRIFSSDTSNYRVVRRGQFAFPANHIEEGSIGLLRDHPAGLVSPIYIVFEATERVLPEFLYAVFKSRTYRHIFSAATNSSVNRRGSLRWIEFRKLRVPLPCVEEQQRIVDTLLGIEREIDGVAPLVALLDKQKRASLDQLISGELRLPHT